LLQVAFYSSFNNNHIQNTGLSDIADDRDLFPVGELVAHFHYKNMLFPIKVFHIQIAAALIKDLFCQCSHFTSNQKYITF
jgi:hypothetical protein